MANLTTVTDCDRSRGQIILVAAFILAVSFVVLALVVNSAIFTENLATRPEVPGSTDALEYRGAVEGSVGDLIVAANENESRGTTDVENSVENLSSQGGFGQSVLGRVVNVSFDGSADGIRIAQDNASRDFTSNASNTTWTVVEDVQETRNFQMNITNPGSVDFRLELPSSDGTWQMEVSDTGGADSDVDLSVTNGSRTRTCTRTSVGNAVQIDITGGTFGGEPCFALNRDTDGTKMWFATGLTKYDINFTNANNVEGTYSLVVRDNASTDTDSDYLVSGQDPDFPYVEDSDIVYSVNVSFAYYTPSVAYETEIRAAPGEAPP